MRKKILAFVFAAAMMVALAVPLFGGVGTALAGGPPTFVGTPGAGNTAQAGHPANSADAQAEACGVTTTAPSPPC